MTVNELAAHIEPGDVLVVAQVLGEPTVLLEELFDQVEEIADLRMFVGMSLTDVMTRAPANIRLISSVGMPPNADLISAGRMDLIACHMSELPWLLTDGPLQADVALIMVSPPDVDGFCSLGVTSDYIWHAIQSARVVLAEINERVPFVVGDTQVHLSQIAASVRTSHPLPEYRRADPSSLELEIAGFVAPYVRDGSCLQVGIGRLGEAVLSAVSDRRDLGVHAGMIGDTLLELMQRGIVTNACKEIDDGLSVAGSILGSARAVSLAGSEPRLALRSIGYTHAARNVEQLSRFVCVNSALEVDLLGQINTEMAGSRYVGAIGGSVDFLRSSTRAPDGCSVVALPTTTPRGQPRIVPRVQHVSALGSDIDVVATEFGVAELRGQTQRERTRRIIAVAAPEQRDELLRAAEDLDI